MIYDFQSFVIFFCILINLLWKCDHVIDVYLWRVKLPLLVYNIMSLVENDNRVMEINPYAISYISIEDRCIRKTD